MTGVTAPVVVPVGGCQVVGGATTPVAFPFNSTVTISEVPSAGNVASAITTTATWVSETVGVRTPTLTTEPIISGTPTLGASASSLSGHRRIDDDRS